MDMSCPLLDSKENSFAFVQGFHCFLKKMVFVPFRCVATPNWYYPSKMSEGSKRKLPVQNRTKK